MHHFINSRWRVKFFFILSSFRARKKNTHRLQINVDRDSEITRKRKMWQRKWRSFMIPPKTRKDMREITADAFLHFEQETIDSKDAEQNVLSTLTMQEEAFVENAFHGSNRYYKFWMIATNLGARLISYLNWKVINLYLEMLKERGNREPMKSMKCHFFNTFFYVKLAGGTHNYTAIKRWTNPEKLGYNIFDCDYILVPIHDFDRQHWCLAIINIKERKIQYFDSLNGRDHANCVFNVLGQYIKDNKDKCREYPGLSEWKREYVENLPKQMNNYDCGVFMLKYADFLGRGIPINFTQEDIPYFRKRIAMEILRLRAE